MFSEMWRSVVCENSDLLLRNFYAGKTGCYTWLKLSIVYDLPLGRQKNKPQDVRYVGLTTWKAEK